MLSPQIHLPSTEETQIPNEFSIFMFNVMVVNQTAKWSWEINYSDTDLNTLPV